MGPGSALALLACPGRRKLFPRRVFRPSLAISLSLLKTEGAGVPECALHPRSRVPLRKGTAHLHTGSAESTPTSPTQWLYGVLRALPGERRCLPPSPANDFTDLTPRSRR